MRRLRTAPVRRHASAAAAALPVLAAAALASVCAAEVVPAVPARPAAQQPGAGGVTPHAGMLRYPDVSRTHVVFLYANDLWVVPREGGTALPLSSPPGVETFPKFSPDGRNVAFVGNYDGNRDLYSLPLDGGVATRVTYHPATETLCDWTADNRLLYSTNGFAGLGRQQQLFTVAPGGGAPAKLPVPYGEDGALSPDGKALVYLPHSTDNRTWKRYRGGMATDLYHLDLTTKKAKRLTDWEGTDTLPMWHGGKVYYVSDAGPEHRLNLWVLEPATGRKRQLTKYADYDVKWPSVGPGADGKGGEIVFQHGAALMLLDLATEKAKAVTVRIPGDRPRLRPRPVDVTRSVSGIGISPTGKRAVIEARGDIWTAPAKNGTPRNLTRTGGVAERDPSWSPDGRWIAYFSDATGEYELYVTQSDGMGETKQLTKGSKGGFRSSPVWSPDGKHVVFADNSATLYLHTVATGVTKTVDTDPWASQLAPVWSPDSRWLAYARTTENNRQQSLWVYDTTSGEKRQVTSGMFNENSPAFDRKGDYLYYTSSRSFSPTYEDLGTTWIYTGTEVLHALPLRKNVKNPFDPKSDEETWKSESPAAAPKTEAAPEFATAAPSQPAATAAAQADEVSGTWSGTITGPSLPNGTIAFTMTLALAPGGAVTGTADSPGQPTLRLTGTYNAATRELSLSTSVDGNAFVFSGKVAGNAFSGTATFGGETLQVSATRQGGAPAPATPPPAGAAPQAPAAAPAAKPAEPVKVTIDFDGIEARAVALPLPAGRFGQLAVNDRGHLLFVRQPLGPGEPPAVKSFDVNDEKREEKVVAAGAGGFDLSPDGKKLLVARGTAVTIQDAVAGAPAGDAVVMAPMTATADPRAEWKQMFHEAWRLERDYFYDPSMHGVDWPAVRARYEKMLGDAASREDVGYIISEMISELNVGHAYYSGPESEVTPSVPVGLLGADFELANGAYRVARIYEGGPWDSDARGPLSQPGVDVKAGDYLLAVNGVPVETDRDVYAAFQGMADRVVTLTVSAKPTRDASARQVTVRLLGSESPLRYRDWIEKNRQYVEKKSAGRIGYVYVPDTGVNGQNDLMRQLIGQRGKEALLIDERWNGGGQIPTRFIELLNRPATNFWARRHGKDWVWPPDSHQGPKAMLINGLAGSGGDAFPYYFKQAKMGKLVGTRTWGGLVGISGGPSLLDGANVTMPAFAFFERDGTWGVEGHGVDPDIPVWDDPSLLAAGSDPQMDAAIAHLLEELKRAPFVPAKRPASPNRRGFGVEKGDQ